MNRARFWLATTILTCMFAVGSAWGTATVFDSHTASVCKDINNLKSTIDQQLHRSLILLGTKGGAGYRYYQAHPDELRAARGEITREITAFSVSTC